MPFSASRRERAAAAIAIAVHAAALAAVLAARARGGGPAPRDASAEREVAIELVDPPGAAGAATIAPPTEPSPAAGARDEAPRPAVVGGAAIASLEPSRPASSADVMTGPGDFDVAPEGGGDGEADAGAQAIGPATPLTPEQLGIGLGGSNPFLPRRQADLAPPSREEARHALRDALHAADAAKGRGPDGPVRRALGAATSVSLAPVRGRAVFVVRAGADGLVTSIELADASGGSGWDDAARIAREDLRGHALSLPKGAAGLVLRVEVTSAWQLPSGQDVGSSGFGARGAENGDGPAMTLPDPSNIGAKPRRVVHTALVDSHLL